MRREETPSTKSGCSMNLEAMACSRRKVSAIIAGAIMDEVYGAFRIDNGDAGKRVSPGRPGMCKKRSLAAGEDL